MKRLFGKVDLSKWVTIGFWCILALGISLRGYQYLMGSSLWEDEAHLALNFISRGYAGLLKPLDYAQSAPILFLFSVESITKIFGFSEYALRAFSFIVSIITLPLFFLLVKELTGKNLASLIGYFLFTVNLALIYFVNELKPYTIDVSVFVIMGLVAFTSYPIIARNRNKWLALAGSLAILYSNISFIILICIGACFVTDWFLKKHFDWRLALVFLLWACIFGINYYFFIYQYPYANQVRAGWSFAYMPLDILSCEFVNFLKSAIETTFFTLLLYVSDTKGAGWIVLLILVSGVRYCYLNRNYRLLIFACGPVIIHLGISALHLYPFYYRFILYLVPAFIILIAVGIEVIFNFVSNHLHKAVGVIFICGTVWLFTESSAPQYPLWEREIKPSIDFINKNYSGSNILITTPHTLYKYYHETGYAKNGNYRFIDWNLTPEQFSQWVVEEQKNFLLLHAMDTMVDGYGPVIRYLRNKNLIANEFEYKTYKVTEIKPLQIGGRVFTYKNFKPEAMFELNGEKVIANWGNTVLSYPFKLPAGNYDLVMSAKGTPAFGIHPHLHVYANENKLGSFFTSDHYSAIHFNLELMETKELILQIIMDNDTVNTTLNEDRNAFIRSIVISKKDKN